MLKLGLSGSGLNLLGIEPPDLSPLFSITDFSVVESLGSIEFSVTVLITNNATNFTVNRSVNFSEEFLVLVDQSSVASFSYSDGTGFNVDSVSVNGVETTLVLSKSVLFPTEVVLITNEISEGAIQYSLTVFPALSFESINSTYSTAQIISYAIDNTALFEEIVLVYDFHDLTVDESYDGTNNSVTLNIDVEFQPLPDPGPPISPNPAPGTPTITLDLPITVTAYQIDAQNGGVERTVMSAEFTQLVTDQYVIQEAGSILNGHITFDPYASEYVVSPILKQTPLFYQVTIGQTILTANGESYNYYEDGDFTKEVTKEETAIQHPWTYTYSFDNFSFLTINDSALFSMRLSFDGEDLNPFPSIYTQSGSTNTNIPLTLNIYQNGSVITTIDTAASTAQVFDNTPYNLSYNASFTVTFPDDIVDGTCLITPSINTETTYEIIIDQGVDLGLFTQSDQMSVSNVLGFPFINYECDNGNVAASPILADFQVGLIQNNISSVFGSIEQIFSTTYINPTISGNTFIVPFTVIVLGDYSPNLVTDYPSPLIFDSPSDFGLEINVDIYNSIFYGGEWFGGEGQSIRLLNPTITAAADYAGSQGDFDHTYGNIYQGASFNFATYHYQIAVDLDNDEFLESPGFFISPNSYLTLQLTISPNQSYTQNRIQVSSVDGTATTFSGTTLYGLGYDLSQSPWIFPTNHDFTYNYF